MNPTLNAEMREVLDALDAEPEAAVVVLDRGRGGLLVVLTGAGEAFSAGMDLKEYFREVDAQPDYVQRRVRRDNSTNRSFSIGKGGRSVGVQQFLDQKSILRPGLQTYTRESGRRRASAGRPAPGLTWALQRRRHRPPGGDSTGRRALPGA